LRSLIDGVHHTDRFRRKEPTISARRTNIWCHALSSISATTESGADDANKKKLSSIIRPGQSDWVRVTVSQDRRHHSFKLSILCKLGHRHRCACRGAIQNWPGAQLDCVVAARLATTVRTSRARPASSTAHRKRFGGPSRRHTVSFVTFGKPGRRIVLV
jgi:hypothetical protein